MRSFLQTFAIVAWLCAVIVGQVGNRFSSPVVLEVNQKITREFKSGDVHVYLVELSAGGAARVFVEQRGVDVIVTSYRPEGAYIKYVDSPNGANGPEHLLFVASSTGTYRVEITSFDTTGAGGRYDIELDSVFSPDQFQKLPAAEKKMFTEIPRPLTVFDQQRMRQNELVMKLQSSGIKYEGRRAVVIAEQGLLTQQELIEYGILVNKGVDHIERYLGIKFDDKHYGNKRLNYFISNDLKHSYFSGRQSRQPFAFLEGPRVKEKTDPYLHETAHAILGETGSSWLAEGLANYVSSYVSEHFDGYDHKVFGNRGNRGVDKHVKELLADRNNALMLKKIFAELEYFDFSEFANDDQIQGFRNVAYPVSHSFVKFLIKKIGLGKVKKIYLRKDTDRAIDEVTGKNKDGWIKAWLNHLNVKGAWPSTAT